MVTSSLTPMSETPFKRPRLTTADTTDPGPSTRRRGITSESAQRSLVRSQRSRYERKPSVAPSRRSARLRGGPSSSSRPHEEDGERTPRATLRRSAARHSISQSHYKPRASLLQSQATPLTIERRAGMLCDVAKAVLLEYVRFADATDKHAQRRDTSWKKLQGAHMIMSDEPTPPFLDLETVIGALTTHQKQNILSGRIPSLQTGLKLSNFVGFLHIIIDPVRGSSLLNNGAQDRLSATTDIMYLAWKKFWSVVIGDDMVHDEAIDLWLDYSTQIYLNSMGVPDPDLFSPSKRSAISGGRLDEVFSPSALERLSPRAVQSSGALHSESKQAVKLWKVRSASRKKLLLQGDPVELRRRFPYSQFRSEMVAYATNVLGRSRLLGMSPRQLAAAIDGEDPSLLTDEEDSEAVASGLEADASDLDMENVRTDSQGEVTEDEEEHTEHDAGVYVEPDNFFDDELLRQVAMELEVEAGGSGVGDDSDQNARQWGLREDREQHDLVESAIAGPSAANNTDKAEPDSGSDDNQATPKTTARSSTSSQVTPRPEFYAEHRRASNLLQRSRDVFGKALTPSRWNTTMLFGRAASTVQDKRPKRSIDSESDGISSFEGETGGIFGENDMLLPSTLALAEDALARSASGSSSASVASEEEEEEVEDKEEPVPSKGVEDEGTPQAYHDGFSQLPGTLALAEDIVYHPEERRVESAVAQEARSARSAALDMDFVDNDFGDDIDYPREPSVAGNASEQDFEPVEVYERASQRAKKPRIPVPGDNEFADDESHASSRHSVQRTLKRTPRPSGVRGPTAQMDAPVFPSPFSACSNLRPPVPPSEDSRLHSRPPAPRRVSSSTLFRLPRDFRETAGRVTELYASHVGDTDPFMVDEDGTPLRSDEALRLKDLPRPETPALSSQFGALNGGNYKYRRLDGTRVKWTSTKTLLLYRTIQKISEYEQNPLQVVELLHGEYGIRSTVLEARSKQHMRDKLKEVVKSRLNNKLPVVGNVRRFAQLSTRVRMEWVEEDDERVKNMQGEARVRRQAQAAEIVKEKRKKRKELDSDSEDDLQSASPEERESEEEQPRTDSQVERLPAGTRSRPGRGKESPLFLPNEDTDGETAHPQPSTRRNQSLVRNVQPVASTTSQNGKAVRRSRPGVAKGPSPEPQARKSSVVPETNEELSEPDENAGPATARSRTRQSKEPVREKARRTRAGSSLPPVMKATAKPIREMAVDDDLESEEQEEEMNQAEIIDTVNRAKAERALLRDDREYASPEV